MVPDRDRPARRATFLLLALAYAACEVAAYPDGHPRPFGVGFGLVLFTLTVAASYLIPTPIRGRPPRWVTVMLIAALGLPILAEPLLRELTDSGFPLELQIVNGLRNLGLALAAGSAWPSLRRLAGIVALFLALFASAMGDQPAIPYLLAALAVTGGVWLVLNHRAGLTGATGTTVGEVESVGLRLPVREAVVFGTLALAAVTVAVAGPRRVMASLGELMPTSGGTGSLDPFARYGTGDGHEEVAGDNARAAGMVDSEKMIEDTRDALIDAVSDLYGPPHKPRQDQERMVAAGKVDVIPNHGKLPENRRPSRDFDTARAGPKDGRKPGSIGPRAVFEVEGRTPLHVRVVAYERYDPAARRWEEVRKPASRLLDADGGDWMRVGSKRAVDWYAADDRHRLKVADLKSNLVPTPAMLTRFRINRVDRPEYYEWDHDGVLALAGRKKTPPGVVVHTDCRTLDPDRLPETAFPAHGAGVPSVLLEVPDALSPDLARLASDWAGDRPRGWPQVASILDRLRDGYTLDRSASAPVDHLALVLWFLTESRRGPDYLFATSAALLLRSLGYPARVCLGYYAAPDAYDPETGHTPVRGTDLHVWPEVLLTDGHWLVVEPTPSYEVLPPNRSFREQVAEIALGIGHLVWRNAGAVAVCVIAAVALVLRRRHVANLAYTLTWWLAPGRDGRQVVLRSLHLLERRGRLAGCPRPAAETLAGWVAALRTETDPELSDLIRLGEWAAYAPTLDPPEPADQIAERCRRVLNRWSLSRLSAAGGSA